MGPKLLFLFTWLVNATVVRDLTKIDLSDDEIIQLIKDLYDSGRNHQRLQRKVRHMERVLFELRDKSRDDHSQESFENFRNYVKMLATKNATIGSPHHRRKSDTSRKNHRKRKSPKPANRT